MNKSTMSAMKKMRVSALELPAEVIAVILTYKRDIEQAPWRRQYNVVMAQLYWVAVCYWRDDKPCAFDGFSYDADLSSAYDQSDDDWFAKREAMDIIKDGEVIPSLQRLKLPLPWFH
jgi:hypothetical protein